MEQFDDYELLTSSTVSELNDEVRRHLRMGYRPWESPNVAMDDKGHKIYIQAVVKLKK